MADTAQLARKREKYKAQIAVALQEEEDPLALYEQFVKWTAENYPAGLLPRSGLVELLEEATRQFKDDPAYKGDLRYLKLWLLYASHVEDPAVVYHYLVSHDIGVVYAQVYEEYAVALERNGRRADAEKVYLHGIKRKARPLERLKKRYTEFQSRGANSQPPRPRNNATVWQDAPPEVQAIRRDPLKNHKKSDSSNNPSPTAVVDSKAVSATDSKQSSSSSSRAKTSVTTAAHDRYAPMLAPPAPGKRPEKLRFNLSLLFTDERIEYSVQEARARSMGLLGKKWAPLPTRLLTSTAPTSSTFSSATTQSRVNFDGGTRNMTRRGMNYIGGGAEPTVTLATKEALADVFGMYNSPEKSMRFGAALGSKHAPVRRVEPVTPIAFKPVQATMNGNASEKGAKTPVAFRPLADENVGATGRKENRTPAAKFEIFRDEETASKKENNGTPSTQPAKFEIFRDEDPTPPSAPTSVPTPKQARHALTAKSPAVFLPTRQQSREEMPTPVFSAKPVRTANTGTPKEMEEDKPVFSDTVFSVPPAPSSSSPAIAPLLRRDIFVDPSEKEREPVFSPVFSVPSTSSSSSNAAPATLTTKSTAFKPYVDEPVFSRPNLAAQPSAPSTESREDIASPQPIFSASTAAADSVNAPTPMTVAEDELYDSSESDFVDDNVNPQMPVQIPLVPEDDEGNYVEDDSMFDDQDAYGEDTAGAGPGIMNSGPGIPTGDSDAYDEEDEYEQEVPLGGRLGKFSVMTPITERTFEYTTSMRGTPGEGTWSGTGVFSLRNALASAEQLAAELRAEEEGSNDEGVEEDERHHDMDGDEHDEVQQVEERTGTLSLSDVLVAAGSFCPPNPCNPSDPSIISSLMSFLPSDPGFHDFRAKSHQESNQLDALQCFAKQQERKGGKRGSTGDDDNAIEINVAPGRVYSVVRKLGEGGFGAVFETVDSTALAERRAARGVDEDEFDDFEEEDEIPKVALKVVRPRSIWEFHVLRRVHQKLADERLRQSVVIPEALYAFRDESFLVMELCSQGTLLEIVNKAGQAGLDRAGSCSLDELLVMFFTIELMRLLEGLHRAGFIHGDMKIDNCLLRLEEIDSPSAWNNIYQPSGEGGWSKKGIKLIDFGRTIDTQLFPADQTFVGDWPTDTRDCFELREGKPWTYQADYFGLAGIIYCMLYGQYIDASSVVPAAPAPDGRKRYKLAQPFKRYWQGEIWTRVFDILLNPTLVRPDEQLPLCDEMHEIRLEMEAWLQANCNRASNTLKGLLKKVALYVLGGKDGR